MSQSCCFKSGIRDLSSLIIKPTFCTVAEFVPHPVYMCV